MQKGGSWGILRVAVQFSIDRLGLERVSSNTIIVKKPYKR